MLAVTLLLIQVAGAEQASDAKRAADLFCHATAGFCIRFPSSPRASVETSSVKTGTGGVMRRFTFQAVSDATIYRVEVGVPPVDYIAFKDEAAFLEAVEGGMKRGRLVRSLSSAATIFQKTQARRFEYEHREKAGVFRTAAILFIANRRIYTLTVTSRPNRVALPQRENFFSSFRLR